VRSFGGRKIFSGRRSGMDGYRIVEVGSDFVVLAGDLSVLRCQTERDAEMAVATALDHGDADTACLLSEAKRKTSTRDEYFAF
jgi:hypothetical protein